MPAAFPTAISIGILEKLQYLLLHQKEFPSYLVEKYITTVRILVGEANGIGTIKEFQLEIRIPFIKAAG